MHRTTVKRPIKKKSPASEDSFYARKPKYKILKAEIKI